ncbi:MAG: lipopolysaccharide heptosyltransferase II [Candidatus Omnitrophota bacterium]
MSDVNKILFVTLSNIGDVILTLPALDTLRASFPQSRVTVIVGPRPKEIFENHPGIHRLIVYDKHSSWKEKVRLFRALASERFDMVIDLRNSFFHVFLGARYKTSLLRARSKASWHMKEQHLHKVKRLIGRESSDKEPSVKDPFLQIKPDDEEFIYEIFRKNNITAQDKIAVVAAGARSPIKRWGGDKFKELTSLLYASLGMKVILVGGQEDLAVHKFIADHSRPRPVDLTAKTSLAQLACLLRNSKILITNDSAVLHLASYLNIPVVAIFGPTDECKYGPWSRDSFVVKKEIFCRPCQKAQCRLGHLNCMHLIKVDDVLRQVKNVLAGTPNSEVRSKDSYRRILIVRTDRIGDVVLSTPAIKALRDAYPASFIAMMVSPYTKDIVEGNPYLDEIIVYDKEERHRNWWFSIRFARELRKKRFDLALVLHPTNRVHLITFFAGIPRRVGFNRKLGFLLTDRIPHVKQCGEKHESEYNLDLVRFLGIEPKDKSLFVPIAPEAEIWADEQLSKRGIKETDRLLVIHPGASCPSKIWPHDRFAQVADRLIERYGFKLFVIAGPKDVALAQRVVSHMHHAVTNLAGQISLAQLTSLLRRSYLFISNDSGPVHIASALGLPLISILARNEPGLSPKRWGPLGQQVRMLHKEVGCIRCLAHNCKKEFACLKAISVEDVLEAADSLLKGQG